MARLLYLLMIPLLLVCGGYWAWENYPELRNWSYQTFSTGNVQTLEVRYSPESIMENNRKTLLKDAEHSFLEPTLKFYPYLLLEVKYARDEAKTGEGIILWSMVDGEMVINSVTWEKTHGFTDCIRANTDREEFKVINALASKGGSIDREGLAKLLNTENELLDLWVESCRRKSLIVQNGNQLRLHLNNPRMQVMPETKVDQWIVSKPIKNAARVPKRFRASQIINTAKAAFGNNFAIRKTTEIFLPVYSIVVQNPDGSQMTTYWNAVNGKRISNPIFIE